MNGNWHRQKTDYRERIRGGNCIFIIENKGSLMEIMTPNGIVNYINTFVKRAGCKSFFKETKYPRKQCITAIGLLKL